MTALFRLVSLTLTAVSLISAKPLDNGRPDSTNLNVSSTAASPNSILAQLLSGKSVTTANGTVIPAIDLHARPNNQTLSATNVGAPLDPYIESWGDGAVGFATYGAHSGGPWPFGVYNPFWYQLQQDLNLMQLSQFESDHERLPSESWQLADWRNRISWYFDTRNNDLHYLHLHHLVSALFRFMHQWGGGPMPSISVYVTLEGNGQPFQLLGAGQLYFPENHRRVGTVEEVASVS